MARGAANIGRPASVRKIDRAKPQAATVDSETPPGLGPGLEGMLAGGELLWLAFEVRPVNRPPRDASDVEATPRGRVEREPGRTGSPVPLLDCPPPSGSPGTSNRRLDGAADSGGDEEGPEGAGARVCEAACVVAAMACVVELTPCVTTLVAGATTSPAACGRSWLGWGAATLCPVKATDWCMAGVVTLLGAPAVGT
jgi:hypothetical protein